MVQGLMAKVSIFLGKSLDSFNNTYCIVIQIPQGQFAVVYLYLLWLSIFTAAIQLVNSQLKFYAMFT